MVMQTKLIKDRSVDLNHGLVVWLEAGPERSTSMAPIVLLHGIGSCADSWRNLIPGLAADYRVLAWDAPGYGRSAPLQVTHPLASDYAATAAEWLGAANVEHPILVGHSLGALMAAALAAKYCSADSSALGMVLVSPAQGYGSTDPEVRKEKFEARLQALRSLGAAGLATKRAGSLCSPGAPAAAVSRVQELMSRVKEPGYAQASWMLSNDMISRYLDDVNVPMAVMCGALDAIVTPESAQDLAEKYHMPFHLLNDVGHACYIEDNERFESALRSMIDIITSTTQVRVDSALRV